jgi:CRP/FNR family transcriptional regulator/CRP/FNR family cyclic AMP-dependent transcriptional regulator
MLTPETLRNISLFSTTPTEVLSWLCGKAFLRNYEENQPIILQNEPGTTLYLILEGRVKVVLYGEEGKELVLTILGKGDFFGEMAVVDGLPRSASVIAIEFSRLLLIQREVFLGLIQRAPELSLQFMKELSRRLRLADARIESLALMDVYGRVARVLRELTLKGGKKKGNEWIVENRPTHQEIASMAGTTRESVTRVINDLIRAGYLRVEGKNLIIQEEFLG